MTGKKAAAAAADPVDIRTAVEQWFVDAHAIVRLCRWLADFRNTQRTHSVRITDELEQAEHEHRIQTLFDDKRQARQVLAETMLTHAEQLLVDLGSLQQRLQDAELYRLFKTAYAAIGDDFSHGSYAGGLFAWQVLQPFGYDMRRWTRELSDYWSYTGDGLDIELEQRYHEHCSRCPAEPGIFYAINKRLTLEHSQITRDLATIHGKQVPAAATPKTKRSRTSGEPKLLFERTQRDLVYDFLKLWHRYGQQDKNGKDLFRGGPVVLNELAKFAEQQCQGRKETAPSKATISRWFQDQKLFGGYKGYDVKCCQQQIEAYFKLREADTTTTYQGKRPGKERATYDEQQDLD